MGRNTHRHRWHPWRYLARRHPHIRVTCNYTLREDTQGLLTPDGIYIDRRLTQAERRCTLTHEIIHLERGEVPNHPHFAAYEEHIVEVLTARTLISLPHLIDAALWTQHPYELAEELWVDVDTLLTRVQHLTRDERDTIHRELLERQPWNN
jgi:hypothetical protein